MNRRIAHPTRNDLFYEPLGVVLISSPLLPVEDFIDISPSIKAHLGDQTSINHNKMSNTFFGGLLKTIYKLQQIFEDSTLQEAILTSDKEFFNLFLQETRNNDSHKTWTKLYQYLARLSTNPYPAKLYAGVALGHVGQKTNVFVGSIRHNKKRIIVSSSWLYSLIQKLENNPRIRRHLTYYPNKAVIQQDNWCHFLKFTPHSHRKKQVVISVRSTPLLNKTLEMADSGSSLKELQDQLSTMCPDARRAQIERFLKKICDHGILVSNLKPQYTGKKPRENIFNNIACLPNCESIQNQLVEIEQQIAEYEACSIGQGLNSYKNLEVLMQNGKPKSANSVNVVMHTAFRDKTISSTVTNVIAHSAEILLSLSTYTVNPYLEQYRGEFLEQYGCREVPLLELLSEEHGLGPPSSYQHPPHSKRKEVINNKNPSREHLLLSMANNTIREGKQEIQLNESLVRQLQTSAEWKKNAPFSLELYIRIAAKDQESIDSGDFLVIIGPDGGIDPAGRSFARFHDLFRSRTAHIFSQLAHEEESACPKSLFAELVFPPDNETSIEYFTRPAIRKYEIATFATPGVKQPNVISIDDLVVGIRDKRFYIRSLKHNKEVYACSNNLINTFHAPNVCRFLDEVCDERTIHPFPFRWETGTHLPFLPRIRFNRIVLRPAEWHLPASLAKSDETKDNILTWCKKIWSWQRQWKLPRYVYLLENYRSPEPHDRILIDLENPLALTFLHNVCHQFAPLRGVFSFQELLPGFDQVWTEGLNGHYLVEFTIPFIQRYNSITNKTIGNQYHKKSEK